MMCDCLESEHDLARVLPLLQGIDLLTFVRDLRELLLMRLDLRPKFLALPLAIWAANPAQAEIPAKPVACPG